ncbi:C40 family peptidase [Chromohalobacter nigrandesensis]|uniref:C40 family peptidase n=1 Tax=Chromohalobacter nigrandesensis TaxID=119863 RepID=UPI001FF42CEF|nr:NlpC/P60 family protein [Chromohalobacter nigrandesensis]MCK0743999.1 NlpC/P60 family protein [Chromohalobacter nigrandesensis]
MLRIMALGWVLAALLSGCATQSPQHIAPQSSSLSAAAKVGKGALSSRESLLTTFRDSDVQRALVSPARIREALLSEHRRWVGTPYRLGGTTRRGIDCSALMQHVYSEAFQLSLPRTTEQQMQEGRRVQRSELEAGDLVFFRSPGPYNHVGVYVDDGYFLHASTSQGVKLSRLDNVYWNRHYWQSRRPMDSTQLAARIDRQHHEG